MAWSFARAALLALAVQSFGGLVGVPVPEQRNRSRPRVTDAYGDRTPTARFEEDAVVS